MYATGDVPGPGRAKLSDSVRHPYEKTIAGGARRRARPLKARHAGEAATAHVQPVDRFSPIALQVLVGVRERSRAALQADPRMPPAQDQMLATDTRFLALRLLSPEHEYDGLVCTCDGSDDATRKLLPAPADVSARAIFSDGQDGVQQEYALPSPTGSGSCGPKCAAAYSSRRPGIRLCRASPRRKILAREGGLWPCSTENDKPCAWPYDG